MRKCWLTTVSEQRIGRRSGKVALTVAVQTYMRARAPVMSVIWLAGRAARS